MSVKNPKGNNDEFLASLLHDIKSPMLSINIALENSLNGHKDGILGDIFKINLANLNFIENMLHYYNFKDGTYHVVPRAVSLGAILQEQLLNYKYLFLQKNLDVTAFGFEALPDVSSCPLNVGRIFSNLISNAQKYAPSNSRVLISAKQVESGVVIDFVNDTKDIGREDIFNKFQTSGGASSCGLGLYITKRAALEIQGNVSSKFHRGQVTFRVFLKSLKQE